MNHEEISYIEKVLGIRVEYHRWKGELQLPYYITERYEMRLAELDGIRSIFVWPKEKLNQIGSLKKQIRRIQMEESLPVVFVFDHMDRYHRDAFITSHIPFVVPQSQLYLPFMGTYLQEKYAVEMETSDCFQPSVQLLLFYWCGCKEKCIYMNEMVKKLNCSAMTVTRAFRQLEQTGLFETGKSGVQKYLKTEMNFAEILEHLEKRLASPVAETVYVDREELKIQVPSSKLFLAGNSALAAMGKRTEESIPCYAADRKTVSVSGSKELLNAETQAELQLWKYDPAILGKDGVVDSLSLALSFQKSVVDFLKKD